MELEGSGNVAQGNLIGTDATGTLPLGNSGQGIFSFSGTNLQVGGTAAGSGNTIAFNAGNGIALLSAQSQGNVFLGNSIFANSLLGIDLGGDGVTPNAATNPGPGPNGSQNDPVLSSAMTNATGTRFHVWGTLHSALTRSTGSNCSPAPLPTARAEASSDTPSSRPTPPATPRSTTISPRRRPPADT